MNYAKLNKYDIANGTGVRVSLFVSGCTHHCKGCFNREAWNFDYGKPFTGETLDEIINALAPEYISGLSVLGGEPFDNAESLWPVLKAVNEAYPQKDIWVYTGYTYEELMNKGKTFKCNDSVLSFDYCASSLVFVDVLVEGRFEEDKKDIRLKFRGSSNQRILSLEGGRVIEDITDSF